ncbi:MAG: alpha/beta hydrolase [Pseudomonadota bacterium]
MSWLFLLAFTVALALVINATCLRGPSLSVYDSPLPEIFGRGQPASDAHHVMVRELDERAAEVTAASGRSQLLIMRNTMDEMGAEAHFAGRIVDAGDDGPRGEWLIPEGANLADRLLYIHGGAYVAGSPLSHRAITGELATRLGVVVFSLDYRLMPEHPRIAGIEDCREAYRWILTNGPEGEGRAEQLFIAGDSAGGNLSLSLANWIRDVDMPRPNGVFALCPATDCTFDSPSLRSNIETDHMLGPLFGKLSKIPAPLLGISNWVSNCMPPNDARISPVFADLSGLPPILVQASAEEMLRDDAVRYVNRARSQGSPVKLQLWAEMLHVWHIFIQRDLVEAAQAFDEIERFALACRDGRGDRAA